MSDPIGNKPEAPKAKMQPQPDAPPGLETDGRGNVIPLEKRTRDDQAAARTGSKVGQP
jgi:hypothetical protein